MNNFNAFFSLFIVFSRINRSLSEKFARFEYFASTHANLAQLMWHFFFLPFKMGRSLKIKKKRKEKNNNQMVSLLHAIRIFQDQQMWTITTTTSTGPKVAKSH